MLLSDSSPYPHIGEHDPAHGLRAGKAQRRQPDDNIQQHRLPLGREQRDAYRPQHTQRQAEKR